MTLTEMLTRLAQTALVCFTGYMVIVTVVALLFGGGS